jgi:hypothetical protein
VVQRVRAAPCPRFLQQFLTATLCLFPDTLIDLPERACRSVQINLASQLPGASAHCVYDAALKCDRHNRAQFRRDALAAAEALASVPGMGERGATDVISEEQVQAQFVRRAFLLHIYMYMCVCIYMYLHIYMYICICICIHLCICIHIYVYIYICLYIDTYIYTVVTRSICFAAGSSNSGMEEEEG